MDPRDLDPSALTRFQLALGSARLRYQREIGGAPRVACLHPSSLERVRALARACYGRNGRSFEQVIAIALEADAAVAPGTVEVRP